MSQAGDPNRSHLSIGEVLSLLQGEFPDITISKIRFLESQGLIDPERTPSGYRKFYEADIRRLRWILQQQRENFLPLKVIKERLEAGEGLDDPEPAEEGAAPTPAAEPEAPSELSLAPPPASSEATSTAASAASVRGSTATATSTDEERAASNGGRVRDSREVRETERDRPGSEPLGTAVALSRDELAEAAGITAADVADLERYGLLSGRAIGPTVLYDENALGVARLAAGFIRHGVEGRHLRMYKVAAEREAAFFEQVVMPFLKQRHPGARRQAVEILGELAELGEGLRAAMLQQALRDYLGAS
jgi:DNA-binding transcriptional MerR regulator